MTKLNAKQVIELKSLATFGEGGTTWPVKDAQKFEKLGVVELGGTVGDGSEVQIRINAAGAEYLKDMEAPVDSNNEAGNNAGQENGTTAEPKTTGGKSMSFAIQSNISIPKPARRTRTSAYPFDELEIGQSFFVPATAERPEPAKTMGSTVSAANERHSEPTGEKRLNRKQREVDVVRQLRQFIVRPVEDGAAWGHPGVSGAGVWRVEPTGVEEETEQAADA